MATVTGLPVFFPPFHRGSATGPASLCEHPYSSINAAASFASAHPPHTFYLAVPRSGGKQRQSPTKLEMNEWNSISNLKPTSREGDGNIISYPNPGRTEGCGSAQVVLGVETPQIRLC